MIGFDYGDDIISNLSLDLECRRKTKFWITEMMGRSRVEFQTREAPGSPERQKHWLLKERTWARSLEESPSGLLWTVPFSASWFHHSMLNQHAQILVSASTDSGEHSMIPSRITEWSCAHTRLVLVSKYGAICCIQGPCIHMMCLKQAVARRGWAWFASGMRAYLLLIPQAGWIYWTYWVDLGCSR